MVLHSMLSDFTIGDDLTPACWKGNEQMRTLVDSLSDRAAFDRTAAERTRSDAACTRVDPRSSPATRKRTRFLMWVAKELEAVHGLPPTSLSDPWADSVLPLCVL